MSLSMLRLVSIPALVLFTATTALADATNGTTLTYIGTSSDWYDPDNWDGERVPQAGDDVVIESGRAVVIDLANDPDGTGVVHIRDLFIDEGGSLETLTDVKLMTRDEDVDGWLIHRGTRAVDDPLGGTLTTAPLRCPGCGGVVFNPTPKSKRDVILQSSVSFGLGGRVAASNTIEGAYGPGYYATLTSETAQLGGTLAVETYYGFTPSVGQTFAILTVQDTCSGTFDGLGEGALVDSFGDVGLYISYRGGDGNDVVLTAAELVKTE